MGKALPLKVGRSCTLQAIFTNGFIPRFGVLFFGRHTKGPQLALEYFAITALPLGESTAVNAAGTDGLPTIHLLY